MQGLLGRHDEEAKVQGALRIDMATITATKEQVRDALKKVIDPHTEVNVVEMGLIKEIRIEGNIAKIKMTLTSPFCPLSKYLSDQVRLKAEEVKGIKKAEVEIVL